MMDKPYIIAIVVVVGALVIAALLDYRRRLKRSALQPSGSSGDLAPVHQPAQLQGPQTARAAFKRLRGPLGKLDDRYQLIHVTSGDDIAADGRSLTWTFLVYLPARNAVAVCEISPVKKPADPDNPELSLLIGYTTARPDGYPRQLSKDFRDSAAAAEELAFQGADFGAGSTRAVMEAVPDKDGGHWQIKTGDQTLKVPA